MYKLAIKKPFQHLGREKKVFGFRRERIPEVLCHEKGLEPALILLIMILIVNSD